VFSDREIEFCSDKAFPEVHFAGRWAAKEAFYKALPCILQSSSSWKSVEIVSDDASGRPEITIVSRQLADLFIKEGISSIFLSISHEKSVCTAVVLLESATAA
jgi:holo-[acyl-carrier protein] synthase